MTANNIGANSTDAVGTGAAFAAETLKGRHDDFAGEEGREGVRAGLAHRRAAVPLRRRVGRQPCATLTTLGQIVGSASMARTAHSTNSLLPHFIAKNATLRY